MPTPGENAENAIGAMLAESPASPMGIVVARDEGGNPLYMQVTVLGSLNIERMKNVLEKLRPYLTDVNIDFDSPPPQEPSKWPTKTTPCSSTPGTSGRSTEDRSA